MFNVKVIAAKTAVSLVVVGSLAGVGAGVAGAATPSTSASTHAAATQRRCTHERGFAAFEERRQARYAANTAKVVARETKATAEGHTSLAKYLAKVVARRDRRDARMKAAFAGRVGRDSHLRAALDGHC